MTEVRPQSRILFTTVDTIVGNVSVSTFKPVVAGLLVLELDQVHEDVLHDGNLCKKQVSLKIQVKSSYINVQIHTNKCKILA